MPDTISALDLLSFIGTIVANFLIGTNQERSVADISHKNPNRFVPSDGTFAIWGVIYTLLTVFVIFRQFKGSQPNYQSVGILFTLTNILNPLWIFFWVNERYYMAQIMITLLLITLIITYARADVKYGQDNNKSFIDTLAINSPFSMYLAWLCVATIVGAAVTISRYIQPVRSETTKVHLFGIDDELWSVIMQAAVITLTVLMAYLKKDFIFAAVATWALYGIRSNNLNNFPNVSQMAGYGSAICAITCALAFLSTFVGKKSKKL
ncbi:hypothetical protein AKO1_009943 [Acrasis kona]|uniref:Tryptophan-rich sensory protein n=1 Tax=Acrasis kona TaxID=1008807 RepID=A0AAW2ZP21_9EUKA